MHRSQVEFIVFLEQLSALGECGYLFPEREPTAPKAGHKMSETRKPSPPGLLSRMATVQQLPLDTTQSKVQHQVLFQRVRLESIRHNKVGDKPWTRPSSCVDLIKSALHVSIWSKWTNLKAMAAVQVYDDDGISNSYCYETITNSFNDCCFSFLISRPIWTFMATSFLSH